ncbi:MAG TPA: bifunctional (p)ppGpp synthetase/guanosine-3',5'-bis(diphosphate) 3'-pyrophosphohydrolase [Erysipelotrichaceae bacterium]|nr:bifunctional (p)ppGpp synthetase/guanosine-3',5'-bis(diphosphate) 3'-pyrophosphohydrolase [Erysipelotrichaceae bacterium]
MENTNIAVDSGRHLRTFQEVEDVYMLYISSPEDRQRIVDAYHFVLEKHAGQTRRSGEPYYHHLLEVAYILASLQGGPNTIIAGLLHDIVEDTDVTVEDIQKRWGDEVSKIVDSLTKIQRLKLSKITSEEFQAEDHRKIFLGMARDIRVILIKLADRLHNLRTLDALTPDRQLAISKETLEVYVPIAERLGLDVIKSEMENICLFYLEPEKYQEIKKLLSKKTKVLQKNLDNIKKRIADSLFQKEIPFEISSRVKSIYSIYRKMYIKERRFEEIYDILALRILTNTEIQCYEILGFIHQMYKPVPGRFKDYIAMPKPNMYQSLHTIIVGGDGNFYEIQIRTKEMDRIAETGIAAHWAYKEGGYNSQAEQKDIENKLHWFRDFVSFSNETVTDTAETYMENLNRDIFDSHIYVFTPKGKVIELPTNATPVDFAYRIHTKIGDQCVGALVNGMMVPLNTILKTGDMVEIKTSRNSIGPSEGWLNFVVSGIAKSSIKKFITRKNAELLRDDKIARGKQSCTDAFRDRGIDEAEMMKMLDNSKFLDYFEVKDLDELFIGVSGRKPTANAIIEYFKIKRPIDYTTLTRRRDSKADGSAVYCKGAENIAISLANCCTPIPGDDIIGYITKGKGITVHRKQCPNIVNEKERVIEVFWHDDIEFTSYPVDIIIEASDRNNLLMDVMFVFNNNKVGVNNLHARSNPQNLSATISATIMVSDAKRLHDIFTLLKGITGVYRVSRLIH